MDGVRCMVMRGGSSKGLYFVAEDLPEDREERDQLLLALMGSPDPRQIDGLGGAHPLTSKVAIVAASSRTDADLEYLFLQLGVGDDTVTDRQNCGNLLAGVAPFAIERGLVEPRGAEARLAIHMRNTDSLATATVPLRDGMPDYQGDTAIAGVPGTAASIRLDFESLAGSSTGGLLPSGNPSDLIDDVAVTLVDNGMPVVVMRASNLGVSGYETCSELEANEELRAALEAIRLQAGPLMNLGDVSRTTVPKVALVAPPVAGGHLSTRTFIPQRCHQAIGVLGGVSVATAALLPGSVAADVLEHDGGPIVTLEHPSGTFDTVLEFQNGVPVRSGIVRTARKLMDGIAFPREH